MKNKSKFSLAILVLGASVLGMGFSHDEDLTTGKKAPRQCVDISRLNTRMVLRPDTLLLIDSRGHAATLKMSSPCAQMDDFDQIGFEIYGASDLCSRTDIKVLHSRFDGPQVRCIISELEFISPDEAKKLIQSQ